MARVGLKISRTTQVNGVAICKEGFCGECEQSYKSINISINHKMISIEDYSKLQEITVNLKCEIHGKKLDLYCKKHDIAVCVVCISFEHKMCSSSDVISIAEASENVKQSIALSDLEETISRTLVNVKHCINDQETALKDIEKDERTIKKTIADTRINLQNYLDELERKLLLNLKSTHLNCKTKNIEILYQLKQKENGLIKLREQTLHMKCFASDIEVFLGTCQLNKTIIDNFRSLREEIIECTNNRMELEIHHVISSLIKEVRQFGEIKVIKTNASLQLKDAKIDQAQIQIHRSLQNVGNISLQRKQKIDIEGSEKPFAGCIILPDDRIIIADYFGSGNLMEYGKDGKHIRDISVSTGPYGLTVIDTDRIAVTYGSKNYLEIINYMGDIERTKVQCSTACWGISYQDQKLYVVVNPQGIVVMDLTGKTLNTIDINVLYNIVYYMTTTVDKIYYTNGRNNTVHCCSMTGQEIWVFKDQSISQPRGISVDNNQNVFVIGRSSNNLTVIKHDGKDSKVLLTDRDGLNNPMAVYYNKGKNIVCLGLKETSIALYQVS
ncbi:Hypothetical predicted protein [Mytilus galloprovincialis]|uniref:B box-type domain-containing protein n=1 Tax=Mytilus galloprovincialis TaxID=29158 RepID=A0A8B6EJX9_MYTGA|nr:Hypothetical predicted protein [Mytilus galloprovincialis]